MNHVAHIILAIGLCLMAAANSNAQVNTMTSPADRQDPTASPYGVNNWDWGPRECKMIKDSGARWARVMVDWSRWEPTEGNINWTWLDNAVKNLEDAGLAIDLSYYHTPSWAVLPGGSGLGKPDKMAKFAGAVAARYKGRVHAQEIYNEDIAGIWPHVAERSASVYVPILQACYKAIKAADPKQLVIAGGLWQNPMYYVEDMYKAGAKGYFDALNWHFYVQKLRPSVVDAFRGDFVFPLYYLHSLTVKYDDPKPIWLTELGWTVSTENQAGPVSLAEQAENLEYCYRAAMETGVVDKVFWYVFYMQDGMSLIHKNDTSARFGPSAAADFHRPAYKAMANFIAKYPRWDSSLVKPPSLPAPASKAAVVPNAGFESAEAWTLANGAERVGEAHTGQYALKIVGGGQNVRVSGEPFGVEGGKCYEVHGWLMIDGGWDDFRVGHAMWEVEFYDSSGKRMNLVGPMRDGRAGGTSSQYYVNDTFGKWQELHYPVIVPDEARTARLVARVAAPVTSGGRDGANQTALPKTVALFDDASMTPLDVRPKK